MSGSAPEKGYENWEAVAATLARIEKARIEENFEIHERLVNPNGMSLRDMLGAFNGDKAMISEALELRARELISTGELKPDEARRYAVYASRGLLPPKTAVRIIDRILMSRRYPGFQDRFDEAADTARHRGSLEEGIRGRGSPSGLKLGIDAIDRFINSGFGAAPGEALHIVGSEGSMKTSLALNALCHYTAGGGRALYVTLDMPPERIEERLLLRWAGCGTERLRAMIREDAEEYRAALNARDTEAAGLKVIGGPMGIEGLRAAALASGADVVALDYVTALDGTENELDAARSAAALGRDLTSRWGITVLFLSQMSWASQRDKERGGAGGHSMGGGSLGQFADFEIELFRDSPSKSGDGSADLFRPSSGSGPLIATLRKNRSGEGGRSFEIFPEYPSLVFSEQARPVEPARVRRAIFRPVNILGPACAAGA